MHNCKTKGANLFEIDFKETSSAEQARLLAELQGCEDCREEFISLRSTLRIVDEAFRTASPAEEFWPGYNARLRERLIASHEREPQIVRPTARQAFLRHPFQILSTSVRVPAPLFIAAVLLVFWLSTFNLLGVLRKPNPESPNQSGLVKTQTIEVPVVQERVVTRVVYVAKNPRRPSNILSRPDASKRSLSLPNEKAVASFSGFLPTDDVKLTIIKGSSFDEK